MTHSALLLISVTIGNVLMINFLIAILSTTYENMKKSGTFKYKVNLYQYCERYMVAFDDRVFGELVLHPPPLSYFSALLVPFIFCKNLLAKLNSGFSFAMYWVENILFLCLFSAYEFFLIPIVYLKILFNIFMSSLGLFTLILNCFIWLIAGLFFTAYIASRDVAFLFKILKMHEGCRAAQGMEDELKEDPVDPELKIKVYNEVREAIMDIYF